MKINVAAKVVVQEEEAPRVATERGIVVAQQEVKKIGKQRMYGSIVSS